MNNHPNDTDSSSSILLYNTGFWNESTLKIEPCRISFPSSKQHHNTEFKSSENMCAYCDMNEKILQKKLKLCSQCKKTLYCDRTCQRLDWKNHQKVCLRKRKI